MARPKSLPDDHIRITVRVPLTLVEDLAGPSRRYRHTGSFRLSDAVRQALTHYLTCPDLLRAEADAKAIADAKDAERALEIEAWGREWEAKEAAREARRAARRQKPRG
jgi:hypothetical protein